jgi:predicted transposase/invertase (TIGR01784 family)
MAPPSSPHDALFRAAFASPEAARGLLRAVLPAGLLARLELESLTPVPGSFVDEALAASQSDLLFSVRLSGRAAYAYLLFEHKSEVERLVALQVLKYLVRIWERVMGQKPRPASLPPIIPVVVYHGAGAWTAPVDFMGLFEPWLAEEPTLASVTPRYRYLVDDLTQASDEALKARAMGALGFLAAVLLRDARTPGRLVPTLHRVGELLSELARAAGGGGAVQVLLSYIARVADEPEEELVAAVERYLPEGRQAMATLEQRYFERGEQQGLRPGLEQGLEQGAREGARAGRAATLFRQLELKFGPLDDANRRRLEAMDSAALDTCAERVLTAATLADVFAG